MPNVQRNKASGSGMHAVPDDCDYIALVAFEIKVEKRPEKPPLPDRYVPTTTRAATMMPPRTAYSSALTPRSSRDRERMKRSMVRLLDEKKAGMAVAPIGYERGTIHSPVSLNGNLA